MSTTDHVPPCDVDRVPVLSLLVLIEGLVRRA